jgi:hypothetical protein
VPLGLSFERMHLASKKVRQQVKHKASNLPGQETESFRNPLFAGICSEEFDAFSKENIQPEVAVVHTPLLDGRQAMISLPKHKQKLNHLKSKHTCTAA